MILEVISGAATTGCVVNLVALYLIYRQYTALAQEALEFAGIVLTSLEEEDGKITTDPISLAAFAMDYASRLTALTRRV